MPWLISDPITAPLGMFFLFTEHHDDDWLLRRPQLLSRARLLDLFGASLTWLMPHPYQAETLTYAQKCIIALILLAFYKNGVVITCKPLEWAETKARQRQQALNMLCNLYLTHTPTHNTRKTPLMKPKPSFSLHHPMCLENVNIKGEAKRRPSEHFLQQIWRQGYTDWESGPETLYTEGKDWLDCNGTTFYWQFNGFLKVFQSITVSISAIHPIWDVTGRAHHRNHTTDAELTIKSILSL